MTFFAKPKFETLLISAHLEFLDQPISELETWEIIKTMKNNKSSGMDKKFIDHLTTPLTQVFSHTLKHGKMLDTWKSAKIIVLSKIDRDPKTQDLTIPSPSLIRTIFLPSFLTFRLISGD